MDTTNSITGSVDKQTSDYLKQPAQYTNMTNQVPPSYSSNQPGWYSNSGTAVQSGTYTINSPGLKDLFKVPPTKRYVELPDEPNIEEDFLPKEERDAIVYIPRVGTRVAFSSKNGVIRNGTVTGISVHKNFIRAVKCEEGSGVFVNFAESDWHYLEGTRE